MGNAQVAEPTVAPPLKWTTGTDMISLEEDILCAIMPCGHPIGSESMASYSENLLNEKTYTFTCPEPKCGKEWPYHLVHEVSQLEISQNKEAEKKLAQNYMSYSLGLKQCPVCKTWCERMYPKRTHVICKCGCKFCWHCTKLWASKGYSSCGNSDCNGTPEVLLWLKSCAKTKINGKECPSVRACPQCGTPIEHAGKCQSMICLGCKCEFCFSCLCYTNWSVRNFRYTYHKCEVAPVQTSTKPDSNQSSCSIM